jgi:hypothetical protein
MQVIATATLIAITLCTLAHAVPVDSNPPNATIIHKRGTATAYIPTLCVDFDFKNCQTPTYALGACINLDKSLDNKISSIKIPPPLICTLWDNPGCVVDPKDNEPMGFQTHTQHYGSNKDLRDDWWPHGRVWNDRISSFRCSVDPNAKDKGKTN